MQLSYDLSIPPLSVYPKKTKNTNSKIYMQRELYQECSGAPGWLSGLNV